jgi:hypothetical protein
MSSRQASKVKRGGHLREQIFSNQFTIESMADISQNVNYTGSSADCILNNPDFIYILSQLNVSSRNTSVKGGSNYQFHLGRIPDLLDYDSIVVERKPSGKTGKLETCFSSNITSEQQLTTLTSYDFRKKYLGKGEMLAIDSRTYLPMIRKQEILNAGKIMGVRNIYFMEQPDDLYSTDITPYITGKNWNIPYIESRMDKLLAERQYDFIITMLPHAGQHGHHKTSIMMELRAVQRYKGPNKPIIIAGKAGREGMKPTEFTMLEGFPETKIKVDAPKFTLNRAFRFAEIDKLSYKIVADWVIS